MTSTEAEALLLTGVYGTGKSTVAGAIGDELEARELPFAALDLDWLHWSNMPGGPDGEDAMLIANLRDVTANYRAAGVRYFVLALSVRGNDHLDAIRAAIAMPLRVVRLTVAADEIFRRLARDGRPESDVSTAREWVDGGIGIGIEDVAIANDGTVADAVDAVLAWAGWPLGAKEPT